MTKLKYLRVIINLCILFAPFINTFSQSPEVIDKMLKVAWRSNRSQFIDYFLKQSYNPISIGETSSCLSKQSNAIYTAHFQEAETAYKCSKEVFIAYKNYARKKYKFELKGTMIEPYLLPLRDQQYYCKCQSQGEVYDESDEKMEYSFQIFTPKDTREQAQYWIIYREGGPHFRFKTDSPINN